MRRYVQHQARDLTLGLAVPSAARPAYGPSSDSADTNSNNNN